jgi:hypothetical protein
VAALLSLVRRLAAPLIGRPVRLPAELARRYPELSQARYRCGGLPPRLGGWGLGQRTVAAVTLWRTVWLAPEARLDPGLLLHELRHVHQFQTSRAFPILYLWETVRRGYYQNRYEVDARRYAKDRLDRHAGSPPEESHPW